MEIKQDSL